MIRFSTNYKAEPSFECGLTLPKKIALHVTTAGLVATLDVLPASLCRCVGDKKQ